MKVKNIAFSGFMASILMAGAAYAVDAPTLATDKYVQDGVNYAISQAGNHTDAEILKIKAGQTVAGLADKATKDGDGLNIADTYLKKTDAAATYDAIGAATTAKSEAISTAAADATNKANAAEAAAISTAAAALTTKVGEINGTVKDYVDSAIGNIDEYDDTALKGRVGNLETTVGDSTSGLVAEVAANGEAIYQINNSTVMVSGITATKVSDYDSHVADGTIHVTADQKTAWTNKQNAITTDSKLGADLVDDTSATNKFVTASEKTQITTNATNITTINNSDVMNSGATKAKIDAIATNTAAIEGIVDGTTTVTNATNAANATKDASGNVITTTYATKTELGALKCSKDEYCLISDAGVVTPLSLAITNTQWTTEE